MKQIIQILTLVVCLTLLAPLPGIANPSLWEEVATLEKSGDDLGALERIEQGRNAIIRRLILGLQERPLQLQHSELCREVNSRRKTVPLPAPLLAGEDICLYLRVQDFTVKQHNRSYVRHLQLDMAVNDDKGQIVLPVQPVQQHVAEENFSSVSEMVKYITLPSTLPPGHYFLEFVVTDRLAPGKSTRGTIDFHIGGMNPTGH